MELTIYIYAFGVWIILALIVSLNDWAKNNFYKETLGELTAHYLSTIIFIGILFFITYFFIKWTGINDGLQLLSIGFGWLVLTTLFELIIRHYVFKNSLDKVLADYNLRSGRLGVLVLIAIMMAPYILHLLI